MENNKEIQVVEQASEGVLADALEIIEQRSQLFERVLNVALTATGPSDWVDQNGKPYLQASGAEKVARRFGVRIFDIDIERENITDEGGTYYVYTVTGKGALGRGNELIEAIGTCSSRDVFFTRGGKMKQQDVDITNIKKSAYSNFMGNVVTRLLGIRNLTWAELEKHGITRNGKTSVTYKNKNDAAAATKSTAKAETESKKPYWPSEWKGKTYVHARVGQHFSEDFLTNLGMKKSQKTEGLFSIEASPEIEQALEEEYVAAEEQLAIRQDGGAS